MTLDLTEQKVKTTVVVSASLLSGLAFLRWLLSPKIDRFRTVPGLPYFGVLAQLGSGQHSGEQFDEWARDYGQEGVFEMVLAGSRLVGICSWPLVSKILEMRPSKAIKPGSLLNGAHGMLQGSFFSEGDQWKRERRLLSPAFNVKSIASYAPEVTRMTQTLLQTLQKEALSNAGGQVNFTELLPMYTADVLCATAFGKDLGMLESKKSGMVVDVKKMLGALNTRIFLQIPYWKIPIIGRYLDGGNAAADRIGRRMVKLMNEQAGRGNTVVEKLRQLEGDKLSPEELIGNLTVLFGAGTDTTSVVLSWAMYHLARDQELQRLVAEEELREEVKLLGKGVPKGTEVMVCYRHVLHNAPEVKAKLGDDLHVFRPARWIGPEGLVKCPPFDSLPFGHGARICLGKILAEYEGKLVIAQVLRHFKLKQWQGPPLREMTSFVVLPGKEVIIGLEPRA
ncbi:7-alpha [Durusdinium trenchii]|uniref:Mitochondrial (5-beta-cholestane-3-alpha) n=1 Tax=Durusdinium trenchii TaxID=1381693 RepID=A0ABP0L123_9DINO